MKFGYRKPNMKKRLKARTTGRAKRAVKRKVVPGYGSKGTGWVKDPKRAAYNKVYNKTTRRFDQDLKRASSTSESNEPLDEEFTGEEIKGCIGCGCGCLPLMIMFLLLLFM